MADAREARSSSLFSLPRDHITPDVVQRFLDERQPESDVLEYKRELNEKVVDAIAAMANTDGGIVIVGVAEERGKRTLPGSVNGTRPGTRETLVNLLHSQLQPPFTPEVIPVTVDSKEILIVRVNWNDVVRPVVVRERGVLVRLEAKTVAADLHRLQQLFSEHASPTGSFLAGAYLPAAHFPYEQWAKDAPLAARIVLRVPLSPLTSRNLMIDTVAKDALQTAVASSPFQEWLTRTTSTAARGGPEWQLGEPSTSRLFVLAADELNAGSEPLRRSRLVITQVGAGSSPTPALELLLDVALLDRQTVAPLPIPEEPVDLFSLLLAGLSTLVSLERPLRDLLGAPPSWEGPWGFLTTADKSLGERVVDDRFRRHAGHTGLGASLDSPGHRLPEITPRFIVEQWMKRTMLDLGFVGFEAVLDELA